MLGMGPKQATLQNVVPSCPTPSTRPEVCPWSIETLGPAAFLAACLLLWRLRTRLGGALLLAWALLNLLGGAVLSVCCRCRSFHSCRSRACATTASTCHTG